MGFYVTRLPPGRAEGSDTWNDYEQESATVDELYDFETEEIEEEFDVDGNVRPLDFFFPRGG